MEDLVQYFLSRSSSFDLERHCGGSRSGSSPDQPRTAPMKLEKVKGIRFGGEPRDFATFKREFNEVIVPN